MGKSLFLLRLLLLNLMKSIRIFIIQYQKKKKKKNNNHLQLKIKAIGQTFYILRLPHFGTNWNIFNQTNERKQCNDTVS